MFRRFSFNLLICQVLLSYTLDYITVYLEFQVNITVLLDVQLDNITLLNIYRTVTETISTISWQVNAINRDDLSNKLGNYYNMIYIACKGKSDKIISFDISLFYEVKELVGEALTKSFSNLGYFKNSN